MTRSSLGVLRNLTTLKRVREWLGLSLEEAGKLCSVSGSSIADWQSGHRVMPRSAIEKIGTLIANRLTKELGREVGVKVETNSPWHITAWTRCVECRAFFNMRRSRDRRCEACRDKRK